MEIKASALSLWDDFVALIYPNYCLACETTLVKGEHCICTLCRAALPYTDFHLETENPVKTRFYGQVPVSYVWPFLRYARLGIVQKLLQQLKYKSRPEIGELLGQLYSAELQRAGLWQDIDMVVPVPLHPRKQKQRGYNQAGVFAQGLVYHTALSVSEQVLVRTRYTETQTKKGRESRWQNVHEVFEVAETASLKGKHVLLVDDVVTTGATAGVCAEKLLHAGASKVSMAFIAAAM